jgi:uncharacterized membrane protein YhiD involved in acid resistance
MGVGLWILTSTITILLAVVAFFLKRLIDTVSTVNDTMILYVYKTDENEKKLTGVHAKVIDISDRLIVIENEHKNRKCK